MATRSEHLSAEMVRSLKLLQVCNVGRIVGGTAACAWSVTRALPALRHHVLFLLPPDRETTEAFAPVSVSWQKTVSLRDVERIGADVILLHNVAAERIVGELPAPTVLYLHSAIARPARAEVTVSCSRWLARRVGMAQERVLWQAGEVEAGRGSAKRQRGEIVVGRICTPISRKWPQTVAPFYAELTARCPEVLWEFVGCPAALQTDLRQACRERVRFHPAGWTQRERLAEWDVLLYSNPAVEESFGRTAAEAMFVGCIPIVDRLGGFVEQIPPDCGFLCETIDAFGAALGRLIDPNVRQTMSDRAQQHARKWFSLTRFGDDLVSLLSEVQSRETRVQSQN